MPRRKAKDALDHLQPEEHAQVLRELLGRHKDLRGEANEIAERLIDGVSVEAVAAEVAHRLARIGIEEVASRAGKQPWGYVEPSQAAWDLLEESLDDVHADMKRRVEAGMKRAAEKICQGIVMGLHEVDGTNSDGALGLAPDFPAEAASWSLSILLELVPKSERRAAGNRVIAGVEEETDRWARMLEPVVIQSIAKK